MTVKISGHSERGAGSAEDSREREAQDPEAALGSSFGAHTLFLIIAVVGLLHLMFMFGIEVNRWIHARQEINRLERELADIRQERSQLEAVIAHRNDETFREQLARNKGFIYPDEQRYIIAPLR